MEYLCGYVFKRKTCTVNSMRPNAYGNSQKADWLPVCVEWHCSKGIELITEATLRLWSIFVGMPSREKRVQLRACVRMRLEIRRKQIHYRSVWSGIAQKVIELITEAKLRLWSILVRISSREKRVQSRACVRMRFVAGLCRVASYKTLKNAQRCFALIPRTYKDFSDRHNAIPFWQVWWLLTRS